MTIQRRLIQFTILVILFSVMLVLGLFQVAKGARFHQLNSLHLKYVVELKSQLRDAGQDSVPDIDTTRRIVSDIRAQPLACLALINGLDRWVMRMIDTDIAIELCHNDVLTADQTLAALDAYRRGEIPTSEAYENLVEAAAVFADNSARFEGPIETTVDFIVKSTIIVFVLLGALMILATVLSMRSVSRTVVAMDKATRALAESERLNRQLAHYDSLTGLPNRNLFLDRLNQQTKLAKRQGHNLALLFIDLDRFKNVNDSMGHQSGDILINEAGKRLAACVRTSDTVARIGGDEFNIILSDIVSPENAAIVAEKIVKALARPFQIREQEIFISGSVGISTFPADADNEEDLQKYADLAMYQAKAKGRNKFEFYSHHLDQQVNARLHMEQNLRRALERSEFALHFQPVVRLEDMRISGVEALLRWRHPEKGFVSPAEFIPLAEETGLIIPIGEWVLIEACRTAKPWFDASNMNFTVAVNVSTRQLRSENFVASVKAALEQSGLPASALDIEITESLMIEEDDTSLQSLQALSELGVRLLVDDFGTGHSSLSYLHKLPFNVLKIDRSFILDLENSDDSRKLTASIVAIGHTLGLEVIAEGLETGPGLHMLQELNCEYAQGFYLSKPLPAEEIDIHKVFQK